MIWLDPSHVAYTSMHTYILKLALIITIPCLPNQLTNSSGFGSGTIYPPKEEGNMVSTTP